jgi:hypothetical protein
MTCIKSEEMKQFATTEGEKIKDCSILNVGNKIYAVRSSAQNRKNEELEEAEQICSVNINTTNDQGSISLNDSLVLLMPMMYNIENERKIKPTNFYFNIDKLTRTLETLGTDTFKAHYTELNRAYILTSKQMDFDKADLPKEVKQKEVKPKVVYQAKPQPKVVYQAEVKPKAEPKKSETTTNKPFMKGQTFTMKDNRGRPFLLIVGELPRDEKGAKHYLDKGYWIDNQKGFNGLITSYYKDIATLKQMISPEYHDQIFNTEEKQIENPKEPKASSEWNKNDLKKSLQHYKSLLKNINNPNYSHYNRKNVEKIIKELEDKLQEPKASSSKKDIKDALAGAKAFLKYSTGKEKRDMEAYIRGLEILLK